MAGGFHVTRLEVAVKVVGRDGRVAPCRFDVAVRDHVAGLLVVFDVIRGERDRPLIRRQDGLGQRGMGQRGGQDQTRRGGGRAAKQRSGAYHETGATSVCRRRASSRMPLARSSASGVVPSARTTSTGWVLLARTSAQPSGNTTRAPSTSIT